MRERVLQLVARGPRSEAELRKTLGTAAARGLRAAVDGLARAGRIYVWPTRPPKKTATIAASPPDPLDYVRADLQSLVRKWSKHGLSEPQLLDALRRFSTGGPADHPDKAGRADVGALGSRVLAALEELNPKVREGALVFLPHLRHALSSEISDRALFDRAVLALFTRGIIELQSHAVPSQLSPDEREQMIPDGRGSFYMAIGLRT